MTFTKEQMEVLSQYESYFNTAVNANYSRHPGRLALQTVYDIYTGVTGDTRRFDDNCQHCILALLKDCGRLYFQDKELLEKPVKSEDIPVKKVRAKVKTKK